MPAAPPTLEELRELDASDIARRVSALPDTLVAQHLRALGPGRAGAVLDRLGPARRRAVAAAAGEDGAPAWLAGDWPAGSVGRLMERTPAVFPPETSVAAAIERLRPMVSHLLITYVFVAGPDGRLVGVVAFRELAFAGPQQSLADIMATRPFVLEPQTPVIEAMREVVRRHYPVYPVCDAGGRLLGVVRGAVLFEEQTFEISAQAGSMVGVEKEERITTPWLRSLRFRNPWLQVNLLTTFVTATVVGAFQGTINQIVLLAVFLPVLSDQCNNTGSQALAVTLRGLTFGELKRGRGLALLLKEAWVGLLNGALTGLVAALAMLLLALHEHNARAPMLAAITFATLTGACAFAGVVGAGVPQLLKRFGADPATASSIFLTKATDISSLWLFLALATVFVIR